MRNLTSINSTNDVVLDVEFQLTASDQSTTFLFGTEAVERMPSIEWEGDFGGGFGKTSNYNITIISSLDFIKDNFNKFINGETNLKVTVNSDTFYPHVGRVRTIRRNSQLPGRATFNVYDKFLDDKRTFPPASLVDSYDAVNPEVIEADFGQPYYYGANIRPYYHVPVDCSVSTLLPPLNISSANQVNSVFYNSDLKLTDASTGNSVYLTSFNWDNNPTIISSNDFEIKDTILPSVNVEYTNDYGGGLTDVVYTFPNSPPLEVSLRNQSGAFIRSTPRTVFNPSAPNLSFYQAFYKLSKNSNVEIDKVNNFYLSHVNTYEASETPPRTTQIILQVSSGEGVVQLASEVFTLDSYTNVVSLPTGTAGVFDFVANENRESSIFIFSFPESGGGILTQTSSAITFANSFSIDASVRAREYENYSLYSFPVNTTDISVSENPSAILDDIWDISSTPFVADQSSTVQTSIDDYKFQCYFGERIEGPKIYQEFGEITNNYIWVADSGMINQRLYTNSANAVVDFSANVSEIEDFEIIENPIGSTRFRTRKANEVEVRYNYDFQRKRFLNSQSNNKNNNSFCESADASGINNKIVEKTRYVIDSATASFYLDNLTRKVTQSEEFVTMTLPPKYLSLEFADILKVEHPMIVGSESLYQITQIEQDYNNGKTRLTARELIE